MPAQRRNMKKRKPPETSLDRYDWSRTRRGRWAGRLRTAKVVLLRPEIYELFGSDEAINAALTTIARLRDLVVPRKRRDRAALTKEPARASAARPRSG